MAHHPHPAHGASRTDRIPAHTRSSTSFETARSLVVEPPPTDSAGRLLLDRGDFQIRVANQVWRSQSEELVHRMYSRRGYKVGIQGDACVAESGPVTLQACVDDHVFGTLNVGFDAQGELACEELYGGEIAPFRARNSTLAEFTRLAVEPEYGSKELLGALFHLAYLVAARVGRATDMFIEVNPRHVAFYKRMLNFLPAGPRRICDRVEAPAVLLHCEVAYMRAQAERFGGHQGGDSRTLYPYYCSPEEESRVLAQMASLELLDRPEVWEDVEPAGFRVDSIATELRSKAA